MLGNYAVRVLRREEKILTRPLYEEAFPEDTPPLVDFYYRYRMSENRVYAVFRAGDGDDAAGEPDGNVSASDVLGMTCLNPYRVLYGGREYRISYLSAVATSKAHRRQGVMRACLTAVLNDECRRGAPFVFLEPADPAYYLPFGFAYAGDVCHWKRKKADGAMRVPLRPAQERAPENGRAEEEVSGENSAADAPQQDLYSDVLDFLNRYLSERYAVYSIRDRHYLTNLLAELSAGGGSAEVLLLPAEDGSGEESIAGVCFRDFAEEPDEDARFFADGRTAFEAEQKTPFAMIRITNLPEFLRPVRLNPVCAGTRTHLISFRDPQIPCQDGVWRWTLSENGSSLEKLSNGASGGALPVLTPDRLVQWILAYAPSGENVPWREEAVPVGKAYFDEET